MLGNFSFGDYFKEKAVEFAWDLLTNGYGLPADKLWASVYLEDDEAYDLWNKKIGIPAERIVRLGKKDNFWAMGDTGPCGPCSEIHIDRGDAHGCGKPDCGVDCDCDRFLEIWNLVFMQFNQDADGMTLLPKPSIDTGMGLERLSSILQTVATNYDTDLIRPIIARAEDLSGKTYGANVADDVAMKVIADHSRAAAFLIGDGVLPSNEGRGYVLRRIMRRAIRYGRNIGLNRPFLHHTAEVVATIMKSAYPELADASAFIRNVIENEELRFRETLDTGLKLLNDSLADLRAAGKKQIPGEVMFKLYDTYGFPVDIVQDVIRESEMSVDQSGFEELMAAQRTRSRSKVTFSGVGDVYKQLSSQAFKPEFLGYTGMAAESQIVLIVKEGQELAEAGLGDVVEVITARTPFYGESGGQVGDQGLIRGKNGEMAVEETRKDPTGLIIHKGTIRSGRLAKDQVVTLSVDAAKRQATAQNHTATHILHAALRRILGEHVKQAGSLVTSERLRFDFTHFAPLTHEELERLESMVNDRIRDNVPVGTVEMNADEALQSGAMALFEEKYGDRVRVVSLADFSKELCGGTHTERTGNIGLFVIVAESGVAAGVRRIEALTGAAALAHHQHMARIALRVGQLLRTKPAEAPGRVEQLLKEQKAADKEIEKLKATLADTQAQSGGGDEVRQINGVNVLIKRVEIDQPAALRDLADKFKDRIKSGVVVLGSVAGDKALLIAVVTKDLTQKFHAGKIIKGLAAVVGGGGGGRPDMAQAGGNEPQKLDQALSQAYDLLAQF
jgi:alanyl-tRNA synthetase